MPLSIAAANSFLREMLGFSSSGIAPAAYLGFLKDAPLNDSYQEPFAQAGDNGYGRVIIGTYSGVNSMHNPSSTTQPTPGRSTNDIQIAGTECLSTWDPIKYFAIFKSNVVNSQGDLICWGRLLDEYGEPTTVTVQTGYIPVFRAGSLTLSFQTTESESSASSNS